MTELIISKRPHYRFLVFTSAGDYAQIERWCEGRVNFDLWITYYGDKEAPFKEYGTYFNARKGGKFPNLFYVYQEHRDLLKRYQAIWVADDDLIITGSEISHLFEICERYDLWIAQPAFDPRGKISHAITCVQPLNLLRYTNYVEVTCPLFRKDKLDLFMEIYDPELVGYGVDLWFIHELDNGSKEIFAVIDDIPCINPPDRKKSGIREIDKLQSTPDRINCFRKFAKIHKISWIPNKKTHSYIRNKLDINKIIYATKVLLIVQIKKLYRKLIKRQ